MTAKEAKDQGQRLKCRLNWDCVKTDVMYRIIKAKFTQNRELKKKLLSTNSAMLIEGNDWGDVFWGIDKNTGEGENYLGRIIMRVRNELRYV